MGKVAQWRNFTRQEIEEFVRDSYSYATLAEKLGYDSKTGSYAKSMRVMINELCLDISHFTGQGWNNNNFDYGRFRNRQRCRKAVLRLLCKKSLLLYNLQYHYS